MRSRVVSIVILAYIVAGVFVAWDHDYLNLHLLKVIFSALLAILLWWLVLLGVNLQIH